MNVDINDFVYSFSHCMIPRKGMLKSHPLSTALREEHFNEVLHADFIYIDSAEKNQDEKNFYTQRWQ